MYRTWRREFKLSGIPEEENVLGGDFPYGHLNSVYGTGLRQRRDEPVKICFCTEGLWQVPSQVLHLVSSIAIVV